MEVGSAADWGFLEHPVCKAVPAVLMLLAAFGWSERLLRTGALFLVLSCAFGGALLLVAMVRGSDPGTGGLLGALSGDAGHPHRGGFELWNALPAAAGAVCPHQDGGRASGADPLPAGALCDGAGPCGTRATPCRTLSQAGRWWSLRGKNSRPWCRNCPCWTGRACPTRWTCCGTWRGNWAVCACSCCPTGRVGVECGMLLAPAGGPGPLWPLGVSELFDRPLSHPAVRWGRILRPHRRTGREPERADWKRMGGSAHEGTFWRVVSAAVPVAGRHRLWRPGKIMYIGGSDVLPLPLSREEEGELIARLAEGDQAASSP